MRFIDLTRVLAAPAAATLIGRAESAKAAVFGADPTDRRAVVEANRDKWVAFRPVFEDVFGAKCWYTESRNPGTDDDVDHFRPKFEVSEAPTHGGYWWEALNWKNFRLSSHRSNRPRRVEGIEETLGKGSHFPLLVEADRWEDPGRPCGELPGLLDPTDPEDPPLLTFDIDGRVALSPLHAGDAVAATRVEMSRKYLHLDWHEFVKDRRDLYARIWTRVLEGDSADEAFRRGDNHGRHSLKAISADLIRAGDEREPYSRAAIAYIRRFRDRDWIKRFVLPHLPGPAE